MMNNSGVRGQGLFRRENPWIFFFPLAWLRIYSHKRGCFRVSGGQTLDLQHKRYVNASGYQHFISCKSYLTDKGLGREGQRLLQLSQGKVSLPPPHLSHHVFVCFLHRRFTSGRASSPMNVSKRRDVGKCQRPCAWLFNRVEYPE